jgi:rhodanese-related sulfurtransferase
VTPPRPERMARRADACQVPQPLDEPGRFEVDATWGTVQPLRLAPGVETVGELEVAEHVAQGLPLVDTRAPQFLTEATIPSARRIPHEQIAARIDELDRETPTILFCNGPQCTATPDAIERLLAAGHPAAAICYYRGGMHDWITLGYPVERATTGG